MADFVRIAQVVTSSSATTITFSSIPGTYTNLKILLSYRDIGSVAVAGSIKFNGDSTAANYASAQYGQFNVTSASAGTLSPSTSGIQFMTIPSVSGNANSIGICEATLFDYAGTTFFKNFSSLDGAIYSSTLIQPFTGQWKSTAAITSITITTGGTAFVDGSKATLYGIA